MKIMATLLQKLKGPKWPPPGPQEEMETAGKNKVCKGGSTGLQPVPALLPQQKGKNISKKAETFGALGRSDQVADLGEPYSPLNAKQQQLESWLFAWSSLSI